MIFLIAIITINMMILYQKNSSTGFDILSYFKDYGIHPNINKIYDSHILKNKKRTYAVGCFRTSSSDCHKLLGQIDNKYSLINNFKLECSIDRENKKILSVTTPPYSVLPYQIYSTNIYFYFFVGADNYARVKYLIDFRR